MTKRTLAAVFVEGMALGVLLVLTCMALLGTAHDLGRTTPASLDAAALGLRPGAGDALLGVAVGLDRMPWLLVPVAAAVVLLGVARIHVRAESILAFELGVAVGLVIAGFGMAPILRHRALAVGHAGAAAVGMALAWEILRRAPPGRALRVHGAGCAMLSVLGAMLATAVLLDAASERATRRALFVVERGLASPVRYVPAGPVRFGSSAVERAAALAECVAVRGRCEPAWFDDEGAPREVEVDGFRIERFERTPPLAEVLDPADLERPWGGVSLDAARAACTRDGMRLPTEAEWMRAAAGDGVGARYPWGDAVPTCALANHAGCELGALRRGERPDGRSPYGVEDLAGNLAEWVIGEDGAPLVKGGSHEAPPSHLRIAHRDHVPDPGNPPRTVGFRCVED